MDASEALEIIRDRVVSEFGPEKIVLFGSRVSGHARPDSDLDLLVIFPRLEDKRQTRVSLYNALRGIPFSKDIFVACQDEIRSGGGNQIEREALRDGQTIYARSSETANGS